MGVALVAGLGLTACGGGSDSDSNTASLRLLNASPGYASLDLYTDDSKRNSAVGFLAAGDYVSVSSSDSVDTDLKAAGASTALSSSSRSFSADTSYTLIAYGWQGGLKTAVLEENLSAADSSKAKLTVLNLATDAGTLDVYLTGSDDSLDDATATASGVAGGSSAGALTLSSGTYRLRVTANGDKSDVRLDVNGLTLASTQVATLVLTPGSGGVLVHGALAVQKGSITALANSQARVRVVNGVGSSAKLTASAAGVSLISNATSPAIGSYKLISGSASAAVGFGINGTALATPTSAALTAGGDYTLLVWGPADSPQVTVVSDDNRYPTTTTYAKLRVVHALPDVADAMTLTSDYSALISDIAQGTASSWATLMGGTASQLSVASSTTSYFSSGTDGTTLTAKGLYTLYVFGPSSTVLRKER
ncbi:MAG: DUF4397 domain-containing protein [Burkholderiaceae bacterium]|nr:DUF4397 domain-containing protein [Burkholderiaceae bacterium]